MKVPMHATNDHDCVSLPPTGTGGCLRAAAKSHDVEQRHGWATSLGYEIEKAGD
jgi:hypothetical protein